MTTTLSSAINAYTCECPLCQRKIIFEHDKIKNHKFVKCMICNTKIEVEKLEKYKPRRNFYGK